MVGGVPSRSLLRRPQRICQARSSQSNRAMVHQHAKIRGTMEDAKSFVPLRLRTAFYAAVEYKVSLKALELVEQQVILGEGKDVDSPCHGNFSKLMGVPCCHTLTQMKVSGLVLELADFHAHWHLDPPMALSRQQERAPEAILASLLQGNRSTFFSEKRLAGRPVSPPRNPAIVRGKGRPAGSCNRRGSKRAKTALSTRRDPSGFEHEERRLAAASKQHKCGNCKQYASHNARTCPLNVDEVTAIAGPSQRPHQCRIQQSDSDKSDGSTERESNIDAQVSGRNDESRG
ncbi:hypothetical protein DFS34DRAFT_622549, partial [Phlyctochytrium arcticum]